MVVQKQAPRDLIDAALAARDKAYAPYSKFFVGAALRTADGKVISGCNVENAAYPEGVCAEAGAISAMVLSGETRFDEIVVVGLGDIACTRVVDVAKKSANLPVRTQRFLSSMIPARHF